MTKNKALTMAVVGVATTVMVGNTLTNMVIAKKAGYKWNKETRQWEKMCPLGIDLVTEDQIAKSNLAWSIAGAIVGGVVGSIIRKNYR